MLVFIYHPRMRRVYIFPCHDVIYLYIVGYLSNFGSQHHRIQVSHVLPRWRDPYHGTYIYLKLVGRVLYMLLLIWIQMMWITRVTNAHIPNFSPQQGSHPLS